MSRAWRPCFVVVLTAALIPSGCRKDDSAAPTASSTSTAAEPSSPAAAPSQAELPPGHPPLTGAAPTEASAAPTPGAEQLPTGHPPIEQAPPVAPPPSGAATVADGKLEVAGLSFEVPEGWLVQKPTSSMRAAQYGLPGDAGAAELAVFAGIGGSAQLNIDRWISQFKNPTDPQAKPESEVQTFQKGGLKISIARATGTFGGTVMAPGAPAAAPKSSQSLFGLIVEGGPQGILFVKAVGPEATVKAQDEALTAFAQSAAPAE